MPLGSNLWTHARQRPDALAVALAEQSWTYHDLARATSGLAGWARSLPKKHHNGLTLPPHGRLIALSLGNHASAAPALTLGLATDHAIAVCDPAWPEGLLSETLAKLRPDGLVALSHQTALLDRAHALSIPVLLGDQALPTSHSLPNVTTCGNLSFLVGFTSGTTSSPKAFARNRASWRISLREGKTAFNLSDQSHTLAPGPLSHGITLYAFAETLSLGAAFYGQDTSNSFKTARLLLENTVSRLVAVPTMLQSLTTRGPFPILKNVTTAGAKLAPRTLTQLYGAFPNATIHEYFGASELGFVSHAEHRRNASSAAADTVGHPFSHVDMRLLDANGAPSQTNQGTVYVRADLAIEGYLFGQDNSGFRQHEGWATVGDIARRNTDGSLTLLGREGGMVISGGYNIYPQEVAHALQSALGVLQVHVTARGDENRGQSLIALLNVDQHFDAQTLRAHCAEHLPRYKIPRKVFTVETWPTTKSGKTAINTLEHWLDQKDMRLVPLHTPA